VPVFFVEEKHVDNDDILNPVQRHRFLAALQLSVPVDMYRFCPGGSVLTAVCLVMVDPHRSESQILVNAARLALQIKGEFREFHTRAQKRDFKKKLANVAKVIPSVADFLYKELSLDASTVSHPDTQERMRLIFMGETGLLLDMRQLNPGRPSGTFDPFFEKLAEQVESVTIADERRHNIAHLSQWISLRDMIERATETCPPGTPIPSAALVRLQFAPRNPYARSALEFTSRIDIQYKIQRRQLRVSHPDDHYCAALLKYLKQKAIELRDHSMLMFCDDKAKVPIGEPGTPVSTGVRGRQTLAPSASTLAACDHDMTKASITPSVILQCDIPESVEKSFVRGQVTTIVNDSVFQTSNPFRHGAALVKVVKMQHSDQKSVLLKFTDGGVDHRNTLESVKCASVCLFQELNLDMLILARCAPGHSFTNPAERIMSLLNLGLQNCATERSSSDVEGETLFRKCGSRQNCEPDR
jgi:hypothetical protein